MQVNLPVRNPRANGLNATNETPDSRHASSTAISRFLVYSEYSLCTEFAAAGYPAAARHRSIRSSVSIAG